MTRQRIGFGGGCHWCTEAVFESLLGVSRVEQGWLAPACAVHDFCEGAIVHFEPERIDLATLVAVHLHTHSCTSAHALRSRYRSAVYAFSSKQVQCAGAAIERLQASDFNAPILTRVLTFGAFRGSAERYLHYYRQDSGRPFCERFIAPKLELVLKRFGQHASAQRG